jgi:hypothetical protein
MGGDTIIDGDLSLTKYGRPYAKFSASQDMLNIGGKIGINKTTHDTKGLVDIQNNSVNEILDVLDDLTPSIVNSYDIVHKIIEEGGDDVYSLDIAALFEPSNALFDYKNQCIVFEFNLHANEIVYNFNPNMFGLRHIRYIYNKMNKTFNNQRFLERMQHVFVETSNLLPEYFKLNKNENIMTFIELIQDDHSNWYIASIKGTIVPYTKNNEEHVKMVCAMTLFNINHIIGNGKHGAFISTIQYYSNINYFLNYVGLLMKTRHVFDAVKSGNMLYLSKIISYNPHFYKRNGLLTESYLFAFTNDETNQTCLFNEKHPVFNGKASNTLWNENSTVDEINQQIYVRYKRLYNNRQNSAFPVYYMWNGLRGVSFKYLFEMDGVVYGLYSGVSINTILSESIIARS